MACNGVLSPQKELSQKKLEPLSPKNFQYLISLLIIQYNYHQMKNQMKSKEDEA